ncbi:MAG: hypothetical protein AB1400_11560 [Pseudomonadota bacterium]
MSKTQTIAIHPDAPEKPSVGAACNGCGICCAAEPCPMAALLLRQLRGACRALEWSDTDSRYYCGLVRNPGGYLKWLPARLHRPAARWIASRISSGAGCDSGAELEE